LVDYRSALNAHLLPAFGDEPLGAITPEAIEMWRRGLTGLSNRSKNKLLIQMHGVFRRAQIVWGLPANPFARVEKHPMRRTEASAGSRRLFSTREMRHRAWTRDHRLGIRARDPRCCLGSPVGLGRARCAPVHNTNIRRSLPGPQQAGSV
jgi:hypothetical protein